MLNNSAIVVLEFMNERFSCRRSYTDEFPISGNSFFGKVIYCWTIESFIIEDLGTNRLLKINSDDTLEVYLELGSDTFLESETLEISNDGKFLFAFLENKKGFFKKELTPKNNKKDEAEGFEIKLFEFGDCEFSHFAPLGTDVILFLEKTGYILVYSISQDKFIREK